MNREQIDFLISLFEKINELREIGYNGEKTKVSVNENESKDHWTIDIKFCHGNSEYKDCIIFYKDDDFNSDKILSELDEIITKCMAVAQ